MIEDPSTMDQDDPPGWDSPEDQETVPGLTEDESEPGEAQADARIKVSDLSIPVSVLCGRVNVTLEELGGWLPGSEISLSTEALDEVSLCSGERCLAKGRLIRLNGQLAVRITRISA